MAFSGGTFSRLYSWASDQSNGIKIRADRMDGEMDGMATGLSTCLLKDGTQTASARIPFAAGIKMGGQSIQLDPANSSAITAGTNNIIIVSANGADQVKFTDGTIEPNTDNDIDLGTASKEFKNAFFDGTVTTDALAVSGAVDFDGNVQLDGTLTVGVDDTGYDVKFFGATASAHLLWDASADKLLTAGGALIDIVKDKLMIGGTAVTTTAAELNVLDGVTAGTVAASKGVVVDANKDIASFRNVTLTGELDAGSLDVSGNADIDGTTNLDAVDIDGNVQLDGTLTVGVDDTGYDVKLFGATASAHLLWDASADKLLTAGGALIDIVKDKLMIGGTAVTTTAAELNVLDGITSSTSELNLLDAVARGKIIYGNASGASALLSPGSANQVLTSDGTDISWAAAAAGGKVLQVVTAATSTEATSTSTTYADTNLTADITPANSSNKILVLVSQSISSVGGRAGGALRILRGSTEVEEYSQISNAENQFGQHFIQHLDSPSSTSSTTYHTEFKRIDQSGTVTAQRNDSSGNATSTITLIEIGA
jgi:cytoskeletal protein CcmA (bactofilin family)